MHLFTRERRALRWGRIFGCGLSGNQQVILPDLALASRVTTAATWDGSVLIILR